MKKLVFSALAILAFSGIGFAKNNLKSNEKKSVAFYSCSGFATKMTEAVEELNDECMTGQEYNESVAYWNAMCIIMGGR